MLEKALFVSKLFLDGWEKLLSEEVLVPFRSFAWQRGTLQSIAIHLITLHNILEYMQIAIIQTEAAECENSYLCHSQK